MNSANPTSTNPTPNTSAAEAARIESAIADIEDLCDHVFCEGFFMHVNRDIMAMACERHPKVFSWWESMIRLGHPKAPVVWAEIKAKLDVRAAARAIEDAITSG